MIDKERLKLALESYKKDFPTWFAEEKYKWEAVKCFQDSWNIDAENFPEMLNQSLSKTGNLLAASGSFPITVIKKFANFAPSETCDMFKKLFNERIEVYERIEDFKLTSDIMLKKYCAGDKYHFQNENSISTYLWLRFPNKYYIYKFREIKKVGKFLRTDYIFKQGAYKENLKNFYELYNKIFNELKNNFELIKEFRKHLTNECYKDLELKTLTMDFCFYISRNFEKNFDDNLNSRTFFNENQNTLFKEKTIFIPMESNSKVEEKNFETYTKEKFLSEVYISEEKYNKIIATLERKKNIILQGAPGVGKTFAAKRLAYLIIGEKNDFQIEFVQFHQNYSYEDFVIGWRPAGNNFELRTGIFYDFCRKAALNPDKEFFFIIDEINRGNLSKIFGELLMLIESDHRGEKIKIPANGKDFFVPENLYIIGMMNTADRSLALIDYALRRRFSFINFDPAFDSEGFKTYQKNLQNNVFDKLIEQVKILNKEISEDKSLGKSFCIGHSYFCNFETCDEDKLRSIVDYEILPMLEEYFFDNEEKFQDWTDKLHEVFK